MPCLLASIYHMRFVLAYNVCVRGFFLLYLGVYDFVVLALVFCSFALFLIHV